MFSDRHFENFIIFLYPKIDANRSICVCSFRPFKNWLNHWQIVTKFDRCINQGLNIYLNYFQYFGLINAVLICSWTQSGSTRNVRVFNFQELSFFFRSPNHWLIVTKFGTGPNQVLNNELDFIHPFYSAG